MFEIPPIVFSIVWPILYIFLFVAMVLFYVKPPTNKTIFILWNFTFWIGILLNVLWTYFYFERKNQLLSYILFIFLILFAFTTNILTALSNERYKWVSFTLLLPYLLWLIFAFYYFIAAGYSQS
jgi:tryptophan-rich sensory protein